MVVALRESLTLRRGIFLETRGTPQAPDCWGRDGEETSFAPWAVISGPGLAPVQGGPSKGTINGRASRLGSGAGDLPQPELPLIEVTCAAGSPRQAALLHLAPDFKRDTNKPGFAPVGGGEGEGGKDREEERVGALC